MPDDQGPKSSFELSMERLRKKDAEEGITARPMTDQQKNAIAEVRSISKGLMPNARPLVELIRGLSASNVSVLRATLDTPDSQIATTANSANDVLWSAFVDHGLARELTLDLDVPLPPGFRPKTFALTEEGRTRLPRLLSEAFDESDG